MITAQVEKIGAQWRSAEEIAGVLEGWNIRGRIGDPESCPLAQMISYLTGSRVRVGRTTLSVVGGPQPVKVPLTDAEAEFVRRFDAWEWPYLVEIPPAALTADDAWYHGQCLPQGRRRGAEAVYYAPYEPNRVCRRCRRVVRVDG